MSLLLKLLARAGLAFAFLFPKAGTDDDPAAQEVDEDPALEDFGADPHDDPDDEAEGDPEGPESSANSGNPDAQSSNRQPSRSARDLATLRARTQEAERKAQEATDRLERLERQAAGPTPAERDAQDEERRLRDPEVSDMEKWQIRSNQTLRATQQQAQSALARAADDRDAAAYERKAAKDVRYDKYRDKVEREVERERKQGRLVQRELVLAYLVGQDVLAGNLKSKSTTSAKPVPRGKPTGARSDTPRSGSMNDRQKRAARLQDINI